MNTISPPLSPEAADGYYNEDYQSKMSFSDSLKTAAESTRSASIEKSFEKEKEMAQPASGVSKKIQGAASSVEGAASKIGRIFDDKVPGEWHGTLTDELGLKETVERREFRKLARGLHPVTGEQLVSAVKPREKNDRFGNVKLTNSRRAGWDLTFSAPKSVSLAALVGGDARLIEAHRQAVGKTLVETGKYVEARMGNIKPSIRTDKCVFAVFTHDMARPDKSAGYAAPDLHSHAFLFNLTRIEDEKDGKFRAVQPYETFANQKLATAIYQSELARRLKNLGYEIRVDQKTGAPEIAGISRAYIEASSPRRREIIEKAKELGVGNTKKVAHLHRPKKNFNRQAMRDRHFELEKQFGDQAQTAVRRAAAAQNNRAAQNNKEAQNNQLEKTSSKSISFSPDGRENAAPQTFSHQPLLINPLAQKQKAEKAVSAVLAEAVKDPARHNWRTLITKTLREKMGELVFDEAAEELERRRANGELAAFDLEKRITRKAAKGNQKKPALIKHTAIAETESSHNDSHNNHRDSNHRDNNLSGHRREDNSQINSAANFKTNKEKDDEKFTRRKIIETSSAETAETAVSTDSISGVRAKERGHDAANHAARAERAINGTDSISGADNTADSANDSLDSLGTSSPAADHILSADSGGNGRSGRTGESQESRPGADRGNRIHQLGDGDHGGADRKLFDYSDRERADPAGNLPGDRTNQPQSTEVIRRDAARRFEIPGDARIRRSAAEPQLAEAKSAGERQTDSAFAGEREPAAARRTIETNRRTTEINRTVESSRTTEPHHSSIERPDRSAAFSSDLRSSESESSSSNQHRASIAAEAIIREPGVETDRHRSRADESSPDSNAEPVSRQDSPGVSIDPHGSRSGKVFDRVLRADDEPNKSANIKVEPAGVLLSGRIDPARMDRGDAASDFPPGSVRDRRRQDAGAAGFETGGRTVIAQTTDQPREGGETVTRSGGIDRQFLAVARKLRRDDGEHRSDEQLSRSGNALPGHPAHSPQSVQILAGISPRKRLERNGAAGMEAPGKAVAPLQPHRDAHDDNFAADSMHAAADEQLVAASDALGGDHHSAAHSGSYLNTARENTETDFGIKSLSSREQEEILEAYRRRIDFYFGPEQVAATVSHAADEKTNEKIIDLQPNSEGIYAVGFTAEPSASFVQSQPISPNPSTPVEQNEQARTLNASQQIIEQNVIDQAEQYHLNQLRELETVRQNQNQFDDDVRRNFVTISPQSQINEAEVDFWKKDRVRRESEIGRETAETKANMREDERIATHRDETEAAAKVEHNEEMGRRNTLRM